jgi:hypothetical protein
MSVASYRGSDVIAPKLIKPFKSHSMNFATLGNDSLDLRKHAGLLKMLTYLCYIILFILTVLAQVGLLFNGRVQTLRLLVHRPNACMHFVLVVYHGDGDSTNTV